IYIVLFFFFQAEDGIRDGHVTGVQTCALPISGHLSRRQHLLHRGASFGAREIALRAHCPCESQSEGPQLCGRQHLRPGCDGDVRSEERRVGKECRCRWWTYDKKKNKYDRRKKG